MTFEQYVLRRLPALLGTARAVCGDGALAEDLVQEVLIRLHAKWSEISLMAEPDAYVRRMLINEHLSWRRKWSRVSPTATLSDSQVGADFATAHADRDDLFAELRRLPGRQRAVLGLRYFCDLSDVEIAEILGCKPSTVRVHAARGLSALRIAAATPATAVEGTP